MHTLHATHPQPYVGKTYKYSEELLSDYRHDTVASLWRDFPGGAFYGKRNDCHTGHATWSFIPHQHGVVLFSYALPIALRTHDDDRYLLHYDDMPTRTTRSGYSPVNHLGTMYVSEIPNDGADLQENSAWAKREIARSHEAAQSHLKLMLTRRAELTAKNEAFTAADAANNAVRLGGELKNYWVDLPLEARAAFIMKWGARCLIPRVLLGEENE